MGFSFVPHDPHPWAPRRYQPIIVRESGYAVLSNAGRWEICTRYRQQDEEKVAWVQTVDGTSTIAHLDMVRQINWVKRTHSSGRRDGGRFRINEFGQVIVPTEEGGLSSAYCVGRFDGFMSFRDPDRPALFNLRAGGAEPGSTWTKPRVGIRYTMRLSGHVSFESQPDRDTRETHQLPFVLDHLVAVGRQVRGTTGFVMIVNDQRVALAADPDAGPAHLLGEISLNQWFAEEPCP